MNDKELLENLYNSLEILRKEPEAHSEIIMILPDGTMVRIPAKNEHLLEYE